MLKIDATLILFESPRRVNQILEELCEIEANRTIVVARELTKRFEQIIRGSAAELVRDPQMQSLKGEVVLLIDRAQAGAQMDEDGLRQALSDRMQRMSLKDAAREVAQETGMARRDIYQFALTMADKGPGPGKG